MNKAALKYFIAIATSFLLLFTFLQAGLPTDQVKETTDKLIAILRDPYFSDLSNSVEKRNRIIEVADERIDWYALCRSCLGRHWSKRTQEEKKEYIDHLSRFLQNNYSTLIIENFSNLKEIEYLDEKIDENYAVVRINAIDTDNIAYPIGYLLKEKKDGSQWEVFDIIIEGVSMVKNYRTQFSEILRKSNFEDLIQRLKKRIEELDKEQSVL